jgi:hypothetical protein
MARLEPVELGKLGFFARIFTRITYFVTRRKLGKVLSSQQIAAHHPKLNYGRATAEAMLLVSHRVDDRLKTLAGIRAAQLAGCPH